MLVGSLAAADEGWAVIRARRNVAKSGDNDMTA